jgi:hypothetical protein
MLPCNLYSTIAPGGVRHLPASLLLQYHNNETQAVQQLIL